MREEKKKAGRKNQHWREGPEERLNTLKSSAEEERRRKKGCGRRERLNRRT